jgi:histidinol-phosphatase (PHP family)
MLAGSTAGMCDYHVHTRFSDGADGISACVERALELGLPELGFAEHFTPAYLADSACCPREDFGQYVAAVRSAAARYPGIRLLCGVEADYVPGAAEEILELLAAYPFDYALCAVHFVDGFSFDESHNRTAAGWRDVDRVWRRYYETLVDAAKTGAFDVVAHLDLPKKWGFRPRGDMGDLELEVIRAIAAAGMALEVNTAGLDRHPIGEPYPSLSLLERARVAGVAVTFGSDAHAAAEVGAHLAEARAWAQAAGYDSWLRLSDRTPEPLASRVY